MYSDTFHFFTFGFQPLFLLADDVLPWFVYVIITLVTADLDTPNSDHFSYICSSWHAQKSVLSENLRRLPIFSIFIQIVTKHNMLCTDTGTTQHRQTKE